MESTTRLRDPVEVAPEIYKVLLENDRVRVLDIRLKPGERSPEHSHPANIVYALDNMEARFNYPDGSYDDVEMKEGEIAFVDAVTHSPENLGDDEVHVLNVELKR